MADGQISQDDQIELETLRTELCLTEDEVAGVVARYKAKKSGVSRCPLCGKASGSPASSQ